MSSRRVGPIFLILALAAIVEGAAAAAPVQVLRHPDPAAALQSRWDWALRQSAAADFQKGFWVGFSIQRRMGERSTIGTWFHPRRNEDRTLEELITGKIPARQDDEQTVKEAARRALNELEGRREPERMVVKTLALLLRFGPNGARKPDALDICDLQLIFDPKNRPILWLGQTSDPESVAVLESLYAGTSAVEFKKDLIQAISLHQNPGLAVRFLEKAVAPSSPEPLRREAAEALGEQDEPRAVEILRRLIASDPSAAVKEEAVEALVESPVPAAVDALIELALKSADEDVRKEAISGLAEIASEKAVQTLDKVVYDGKDTEVQRHAVSVLSDLPPKEALPILTRIAKTHANPEVRREAIEALGDIGDPAAVAVLVDIIKNRK